MKKNLNLLLPLLLVSLFSCNSYSEKKYVPKDAYMVARIDMGSLIDKMDIESLMKMDKVADNFEDIKDEMPTFINDLFKDPSNTGIDFNAPVTVFATMGKNDNRKYRTSNQRFGFIFKVDDSEKISKLLKELDDEFNLDYTERHNEDEDYYKVYIKEERRRTHAFAWNDDVLIITAKERRRDDVDVKSMAEELIKAEEDNSLINNNAAFEEFCGESNDFDVFANADVIKDIIYDQGDDVKEALKESKNVKKYIDNISGYSMHLNFEDEEVVVSATPYYKDASIAEEYNITGEEGIPSDYLKLLTSNGKSIGAMGMTFKPELYTKLIDNKEIKEMIKQGTGLSLKDIVSSFTGVVAASLSDFREIEVTKYDYKWDYNSYEYIKIPRKEKETVPIFNIQIGITPKSKVVKWVEEQLENDKSFTKKGNVYTTSDNDVGDLTMMNLGNKWFISNDPKAKKVNKSTSWNSPSNDNLVETITDNPMGMYVSLEKKDFNEEALDEIPKELDGVLGMLKNLKMTSNGNSTSISLGLQPGEGNSLHRILKTGIDLAPDLN